MLSGLRTFATMTVLVAMIVVAGLWGWHAATRPFPSRAKAQSCTTTQLHAGDQISPVDVTVSILNASNRGGLAELTLTDMEKHQFGAGTTGNAPASASVRNVEIWAPDPSNPAVQLVHTWLPQARVVKRASPAAGVTVVVGPNFSRVGNGKASLKVSKDATICSPVLD